MNALTRLCRSTAVALLAGVLAFAGVVPATAATKDLKTTLPTEPVLATPIAVSGKHLLVESNGTHRLSHDKGKHWVKAKVPFTCVDCLMWPSRIGRVANGVLAVYSGEESRLDAYSLVTNARVGTTFGVPYGRVLDLMGDFALLRNPDTGGATVRSLATGTTREVAASDDLDPVAVLADGSVLARNKNGALVWSRISPAGDVATIFTGADSMPLISGNLLTFRVATVPGTSFCLVVLPGSAPSCRPAHALDDLQFALGSTGLLVRSADLVLRWYPIAGSALAKPRLVSGVTLRPDLFAPSLSAEKGYPVVAQRNSKSSWLQRLRAGGRTVRVPLGWSKRLMMPMSLALTPTTLLGRFATISVASSIDNLLSYTWWRRAKGTMGRAHRLGSEASVAGSGARWALAGYASLRLYDRGKEKASLDTVPFQNARLMSQSGPYAMLRPFCMPLAGPSAPPNHCPYEPVLIDAAGGTLAGSTSGVDIFGSLILRTTGPTSFEVADFVDEAVPVRAFSLPDVSPPGSYDGARLWGDWVAVTMTTPGENRVIVHNFRTAAEKRAPVPGRLLALGDGFAVVYVDGQRRLSVWNFVTDSLKPLTQSGSAPEPTRVATDGARVAFVRGGKLVVRTIAGSARSAPRVLGVTAPKTLDGTWTAAIDLTKAVRKGHLEISDGNGQVVRTMKVGASRDGSLRNITWDGRDQSGKRVAAGVYSYVLTNHAADRSGAIRLVDGSVGPIGSIQVR